MRTPSTVQRFNLNSLKELRALERAEKRKASINGTVDYLLRFHKLAKKLDPELFKKIKITLT